MIKLIVNGADGKMGRSIVKFAPKDKMITLVGMTDIKSNLQKEIKKSKADVVVDFTSPSTVYSNILTILNSNANAVIGTTGLSLKQRNEIEKIAKQKKLGVFIAPNFSIGAVLMIKYAADAAKYIPNIEIVEYHHDNKADAPSGTAIYTAQHINNTIDGGLTNPPSKLSKEQLTSSSQGAKVGNIRIHAVRLPGFVASQEVILGNVGQTLSIKHSTINRDSFMPGVVLAIKSIMGHIGLIYGLENIL